VTGACQASGVSNEPSRTGVCVIRITAQGSRMFITLRENANVERIPADRTSKMSDVNEAVLAVHEFLTSFVAASRAD
jgi:sugar/nucleoside kinase (ribokinase family)